MFADDTTVYVQTKAVEHAVSKCSYDNNFWISWSVSVCGNLLLYETKTDVHWYLY